MDRQVYEWRGGGKGYLYTNRVGLYTNLLHIYDTCIYKSLCLSGIVNPRRACARVTVLGLCVCLSVRHHESCHYAQRSVQPKVPTASAQAGKHFKYGVFSKNALFKSYGVKKPTSVVCAYRDIIWRR